MLTTASLNWCLQRVDSPVLTMGPDPSKGSWSFEWVLILRKQGNACYRKDNILQIFSYLTHTWNKGYVSSKVHSSIHKRMHIYDRTERIWMNAAFQSIRESSVRANLPIYYPIYVTNPCCRFTIGWFLNDQKTIRPTDGVENPFYWFSFNSISR